MIMDAATLKQAESYDGAGGHVRSIVMEKALLHNKCEPMPGDLRVIGKVVGDLLATAKHFGPNRCAGLAANQIGYNYRAFVILINNQYVPIINPTFLRKWGGKKTAKEGCLSRPGIQAKKARYRHVKVRYYDLQLGAIVDRNFNNLNARIVQHEIDHLDGVLMDD